MAQPLVYRRLRAPAEDGGVLLDPPPEKIAALIDRNVALRSRDVDLGGKSLSTLRIEARQQLKQAASEYTGKYADLAWLNERPHNDRLYLAGHQPELFHPGVWLKNFVLDALAKRDNATAVHVLVDNDEAPAPSIRVPTGSLAEPRIENIAYVEIGAPGTWEESALNDIATFRSFGERVRKTIAPLIADPLVASLWCAAETALKSTNNSGRALAQLRHKLEIAWGLRTLEVPFSSVVDSRAFQYFTAHLIAELPRFNAAHNAALDEYRAVHKLRSASQPLPNLAEHDGWLEAPFWIWSDKDAPRRKLLVRREADGWSLRDGLAGANTWTLHYDVANESKTGTLARPSTGYLAASIERLRETSVKIRPRALVTTMMLRLLASDLFIHGIGGAKYDQVTDRIIEDFFGVEPPGFLTATGTRLLPVPRSNVTPDLVRIDRLLRELKHNPEKWIEREGTPLEKFAAQALIAEKLRLLAERPERGAGFDRHRAIEKVNWELANYYVSRGREKLLEERSTIEAELRRQLILGSRDFSFCLYPEATLRPWLLDAAARAL